MRPSQIRIRAPCTSAGLEQGLAAREHHEAVFRLRPPCGSEGAGKGVRIGKARAAFPVGADEVGVAEAALGAGAVLFAAGPQVAAGKAAEHGGPPRLGTLALQGLEHLFDSIGHGPKPLDQPSPREKSRGR